MTELELTSDYIERRCQECGGTFWMSHDWINFRHCKSCFEKIENKAFNYQERIDRNEEENRMQAEAIAASRGMRLDDPMEYLNEEDDAIDLSFEERRRQRYTGQGVADNVAAIRARRRRAREESESINNPEPAGVYAVPDLDLTECERESLIRWHEREQEINFAKRFDGFVDLIREHYYSGNHEVLKGLRNAMANWLVTE